MSTPQPTVLSPEMLARISANRQAALEKKRRREADCEQAGRVGLTDLTFAGLENSFSTEHVPLEKVENMPFKPSVAVAGPSSVQSSTPQVQQLSDEQQNVRLEVLQGKSCFLTGCGGTGKSFLTNQLIIALKEKYGKTAVAVTATTGIAACQIGGTTVHTFAGIGLGKESVEELVEHVGKNKKTIDRWRKTQCLIIDEISMLDGDFFDKLETIARNVRRDERPFGGMQLLLVGDFLQLPPIGAKDGRRSFCFDATSWSRAIELNIELTHVFRQRNTEFVQMLNSLRVGICTAEIAGKLKSTKDNRLNESSGIQATRIFPKNVEVEAINLQKVTELPGKMIVLAADDAGEPQYLKNIESNCLAPKILNLKPGAQVMLLKNLDTEGGLTNGTRGVVESMIEIEDKSYVELVPRVLFETKNGIVTRAVKKEVFSTEAQGKVVASRTQFPLRLAYAITIHKCQGMTLSKVELSLKDVFEHGQAYVALSRVSDLQGLRLLDFNPAVVKAHPRVLEFYRNMQDSNKTSGAGGAPRKNQALLPHFSGKSAASSAGDSRPNPLFVYD